MTPAAPWLRMSGYASQVHPRSLLFCPMLLSSSLRLSIEGGMFAVSLARDQVPIAR